MSAVRVAIVVVVAVIGGFIAAWLYVVADQAQFEPNINPADRFGAVLARQYEMDAPGREEIDRYSGAYEEPALPLRTAVARAWNGYDEEKRRRDARAKAEFDATYWMAAWFCIAVFLLGGFLGLAVSAGGEAQTS